MKSKRWIPAALVLLAVLAFAAYLSRTSSTTEAVVRVALVSELTGEAAAWGTDLKEGIDLAIDEVNAAGGINGQSLRVFVENSEGSPRVATNATMKLLTRDSAQVFLGVAVSTVANAMLPILKERRILFVSGGASSPSLSGASPYFFRTWPSDLEEALVAAELLRKEGHDQAIVVRANDDYGVGLANPFVEEFTKRGGRVPETVSFEKGAADFKAQVSRVKLLGSGIVFLAGTPRDMAQFVKQLREGGSTQPVFSVSGIKEQEVITIAGPAVEGVRFVDASFDATSTRPETIRFMEGFRARYSKEPGVLAASGYDSVLVLTEAIRRANATDGDSLRRAMLSLQNFPGAVGPITFSDDGNVHRPVRVSAIRDGRFAAEPPGQAIR